MSFSQLRSREVAVGVTTLLFGLAVVNRAWICDDAFITFRTLDNFLNGYGLRWNVADRVQTFTHPLWLFSLLPAYVATGHAYFAAVTVSIACSVTAVAFLLRSFPPDTPAVWLAGLACILSGSLVDYSTSGLENPLTHLLLVAFLASFLSEDTGRRLPQLCLLAGLAGLNRLDSLLILLPPLATALWRDRDRVRVAPCLAAFAPLAAWFAFATFYYGSPIPNTAFAKLGGGVPRLDLLAMGADYLSASFLRDPLAPIVVATAACLTIRTPSRETVALASGIGLHLLYILWAGGDFMAGRFLTAPFLVSVVLVARTIPAGRGRPVATAVVLCLGLASPSFPLAFDEQPETDRDLEAPAGIIDERDYYLEHLGLRAVLGSDGAIRHPWADLGRDLREKEPALAVRGTVGLVGFYAGPMVPIVDRYGLVDPFVARLPAAGTEWRPGHLTRAFPRGFVRSAWKGRNEVVSASLAESFATVSKMTRGGLFDRGRFTAILDANLGAQSEELSKSYARFRSGRTKEVTGSEPDGVSRLVAAGELGAARFAWSRAVGEGERGEAVLTVGHRLADSLAAADLGLAAIEVLEACESLEPEDAGTLTRLATAYFDQGLFNRAGRAASRAAVLTEDPAPLLVLADLSRIYRLDEAEALYRAVLERDPGNAAAREELLAIQAERGNP